MLNPEDDGKRHINVYSQGNTRLGRMMSNFYRQHIETSDNGYFSSIEGYWYWLQTSHGDRDELRDMHGASAKETGRRWRKSHPRPWDNQFRLKIFQAMLIKVRTNLSLFQLLKENELPFHHYYVDKGKIIEANPENDWILGCWDLISALVKVDRPKEEKNIASEDAMTWRLGGASNV